MKTSIFEEKNIQTRKLGRCCQPVSPQSICNIAEIINMQANKTVMICSQRKTRLCLAQPHLITGILV